MSNKLISKQQNMHISGYIYVKDPKDQSKIDDLTRQLKEVKQLNRDLAKQVMNRDKKADNNDAIIRELDSILDELFLVAGEVSEFKNELDRLRKLRIDQIMEYETYSVDTLYNNIISTRARIKKLGVA